MKTSAPPRLNASQPGDVSYLERNTVQGAPIPSAASLSMAQLYEIERMANATLNLAQIGQRLRIPDDVWTQVIRYNPAVKQAYIAGFSRLQETALTKMAEGLKAGEPALLRLAADRGILGQQWEPKKQPALIVTPAHGAVQIDVVSSVENAFEKQRALLESPDQEED